MRAFGRWAPWCALATAAILGVGAVRADDPAVGTIETVAGGGVGDGGPAKGARLENPGKIAIDSSGNLFIADTGNHRIRKVATDGTISTVAGTGTKGFSGDGGPATSANLRYPRGVALDGSGNLLIADTENKRIRKVDGDGTISTVAGNGIADFSGDGGPATAASLSDPHTVAADGAGNLFIADTFNARIRRVAEDGTITTVAGNGTWGFSGDGGPATEAAIAPPADFVLDSAGNLFLPDGETHRVRRVDANGTITTIAGNGTAGFSGDGGRATEASLNIPLGLALDGAGNLLISDYGNNCIRKVTADGTISTVAGERPDPEEPLPPDTDFTKWLYGPTCLAVDGTGNILVVEPPATGDARAVIRKVAPDGTISILVGGPVVQYTGDGGPATSGRLYLPRGVALDGAGNLYIADTHNHRIRKVAADGRISTVAGSGEPGFTGDGGPATQATLDGPTAVAIDGSGNLYIADTANHRVRRVDADGRITTIAGAGTDRVYIDGGSGLETDLGLPSGLVVDGSGNLYIADGLFDTVRVLAADDTIRTVAGGGGTRGEGTEALAAVLADPHGLALDAGGNLYIAEASGDRVLKVGPDGTVTAVAGTGSPGYSGDGGPAAGAQLRGPHGIALDGAGNLLIADHGNDRIRRVAADGSISTVAGNGARGYLADGVDATTTALFYPTGVAANGSGSFFIADCGNHRIRKVAADGKISTVAGNGTSGSSGDGAPATSATLSVPTAVAIDGAGNLYIADASNHCVRRVATNGIISTVAGTGVAGFSGDGGPATEARLYEPQGLATDGSGNLYIADTGNNRIRRVDANGTITTAASFDSSVMRLAMPTGLALDGSGNLLVAMEGASGVYRVESDGTVQRIAFSERAAIPYGLAVDRKGNLFIADTRRNSVHRVAPDGSFSPVAGTGAYGYSGDGGEATEASLRQPHGVAVDGVGNLYIADTGNSVIRRVGPDGRISTVAGYGYLQGCEGDGGPATSALLNAPMGVAVDPAGDLLVADTGNDRIRRVLGIAQAYSITGAPVLTREAEDDDGAKVPVLLQVWGAVPDGARLVVKGATAGGTETLLFLGEDAAEGSVGFEAVFPLGTTFVVAELQDGSAVLASFQFTVQVGDSTRPTLSGIPETTPEFEIEGPLTPIHVSRFGITAADTVDPWPLLELSPSEVPLGTTEVFATATDASGNSITAAFSVTIVDTGAPVFTVVPGNISRVCTDGSGSVSIAFDIEAADVSGAVRLSCIAVPPDVNPLVVDPAGTEFAVGEYTVLCWAEDESGNVAFHEFTVSVTEEEGSVITLLMPDAIAVGTDEGKCTAAVDFTVSATGGTGQVTITTVVVDPYTEEAIPVASGDDFPLGETYVSCIARDEAGHVASRAFLVLVRDDEAPVLSVPSSVTLAGDAAGNPMAVNPLMLGATAEDNCDEVLTLTCSPSLVDPGTTTVTVTAVDAAGNSSTADVSVTVLRRAITVAFQKPLEGGIDNRIKAGQVVPVQVKVTCEGSVVSDAAAVIDDVSLVDGSGTPIEQSIDDAGASADEGASLRYADGVYKYNLSTKGWTSTSGARFKVTVKVTREGHAATFLSVILRNK